MGHSSRQHVWYQWLSSLSFDEARRHLWPYLRWHHSSGYPLLCPYYSSKCHLWRIMLSNEDLTLSTYRRLQIPALLTPPTLSHLCLHLGELTLLLGNSLCVGPHTHWSNPKKQFRTISERLACKSTPSPIPSNPLFDAICGQVCTRRCLEAGVWDEVHKHALPGGVNTVSDTCTAVFVHIDGCRWCAAGLHRVL